jgi:uncharacterized protein YfbU (UPF0304 family)
VKLSDPERWILSSQYRILAKLYPEESDDCDKHRKALDNGYEIHYAPDFLTTNRDDIMTEDESREVLDILNMFRVLRQSWEKLPGNAGIERSLIEFDGFDGNNETKQMAYTEFYCTLPGGRFEDEVVVDNLNSHSERLPRYRAMLAEYNRIKESKPRSGSMDSYLFTKDEIAAVAGSRR